MKVIKVIIISLVMTQFCCTDPDPCESVVCENFQDNFCTNGICACELNNWSFVNWRFECTNCRSTGVNELFIDVEVAGVTISDLTLRGSCFESRLPQRLLGITGTVPYSITSGSVVLEEGNLNFQTCVVTTVSSKLSI